MDMPGLGKGLTQAQIERGAPADVFASITNVVQGTDSHRSQAYTVGAAVASYERGQLIGDADWPVWTPAALK